MKKILSMALIFVVVFSAFSSLVIDRTRSEINNECRRMITVDNSGNSETLTDYQVFLNVTHDSNMQPDFDDLRFAWYNETSGQEAKIDYWLDKYVSSEYALIWVEVPLIRGLEQEVLYMYYGDQDATSASNGEETFVFFDDFSIDTIPNYAIFPKPEREKEVSWHPSGWLYLNASFPKAYVGVRHKTALIDATNEKYWIETRSKGFGPDMLDFFGALQVYKYDSNPSWNYMLYCIIRVSEVQIASMWSGSWEFWQTGWRTAPISKDTWYRFGVGTHPNGTVYGKFCDDDYNELVGTVVEQTIHQDNKWWVSLTANRIDAYFDYVRVRKFTDPEPSYIMGEEELQATVDIDPDTLNLKSNGEWITAYVTLPEGYSVEDINVASVELIHNDVAVEATDWGEVQDSVLAAKFDRATLRDYLGEVDVDDGEKFYDITLTVKGNVTGTPFEGSDMITVKRK